MKARSLLAALVLAGTACAARHASPARPAPPAAAPEPLADDQVVMQPNETQIVELRVVFEAGSMHDPKGLEGLTHVTVRGMLEGGAGGVSYAERVAQLFPMAAQIDGYVGREQTVFVGRVHVDHLAAFYPLFRDVLTAPALEQSAFERVRARTLSHLTQGLRGANDEALGQEVLQWMLFQGHPYGHPPLGTETGLWRLRREDLAKQWARLICRDRVRVAASGPLSPDFRRRLLTDLAGLDRAACEPRRALPDLPPSQKRMWIIDKPSARAVAVSLGLPIAVTRSHPDYPALALAAAYLGQHRTFAGLLIQKLRVDRGLNYGDYAYVEHFEQAGETRFPLPNVARRGQYFSVWLRPLQPDQAHFALRMAVRELARLVKDGISPEDFERIRTFADHYFALYAQTEQQRLGHALDMRFYGVEGPYIERLRAAFRELTVEEVNQAIARHLDLDRLQVALVAPGAAALAEAIIAERPSPISYPAEKPAPVLAEDRIVSEYPLGFSRDQVRLVPVRSAFH